MSLIRLHRNIAKRVNLCKTSFSTTTLDHEEYTATPNYPPILDVSSEKVRERKQESKYEAIKNVKTIEEKQIKLNMPRYYGFKCYMFNDNKIPYGQLPLTQHMTRTHLIVQDHLPEYYNKINVDVLLKGIKEDIEEVLLIEYNYYRRKQEILTQNIDENEKDKIFTRSIIRNINRILTNNVSKTFPHLLNTQVDFDSRIESFWYAGGMTPPKIIKQYRKRTPWLKHTENDPTNRAIQYIGTPILNLRAKLPLPPIIPHSEASNADFTVPYFKYDPRTVGTTTTHRHAANIPGFWPGDEFEHGLLSFQDRNYLVNRNFNDPTDPIDTVYRQGILSSFAWLNAQATYMGFTTFNDVTYPLVGQSIITNGQFWSFFVYQLNTVLNHSKYVTENPKKNICWATSELKLFDEIKEGKVIGFNDDVLKMLLRYYANAPEERLGVNMKPYLDEQCVSASYEDDDKRIWLEREYKHIMSNRPRSRPFYEVYNWEKIYKIDHEKKPLDARRRPFELMQTPSKRTLDDRQAFYIPRAHRPNLPRHRGRYAKEYFP